MSLLFMPHAVVFAAEPVAAEGALELAVARVHHVMPLQVFASWKSLGTSAANKPFLGGSRPVMFDFVIIRGMIGLYMFD